MSRSIYRNFIGISAGAVLMGAVAIDVAAQRERGAERGRTNDRQEVQQTKPGTREQATPVRPERSTRGNERSNPGQVRQTPTPPQRVTPPPGQQRSPQVRQQDPIRVEQGRVLQSKQDEVEQRRQRELQVQQQNQIRQNQIRENQVRQQQQQVRGPVRPGNVRNAPIQITRQQQQQIRQQRVRQYNDRWQNWQNIRAQRERALQQQQRRAYLEYQRRYWERIRLDQIRLQQARYYDNLFNNYRYYRGGTWYYTNQYGAQMLQDAINYGYEEGFRAGQADRYDGWGFNPMVSYAYQDASFGYDRYYVELEEYNYYFREGFRRGYEDGYYGRYQYGSYSNGKFQVIGSILGAILDLVRF